MTGGPRLEDCDVTYSTMETPFSRDVVKELREAGRKQHKAIYLACFGLLYLCIFRAF